MAKKEAKMGHNRNVVDTGKKSSIECPSCKNEMIWARVINKMRYVCTSCGFIE